ncbi:MAG: TPM domain-containing protein [Alphaproteobacteria bacterium]|nr:TPM domain-containing protein [Alphaproteobacteria bacterium]
MAYVIVGLLTLTWLSATAQAEAAPDFPQLTGRVVDEAGVLSGDTRRELDRILAGDEEHFGGRQIAVVTLKSLQGRDIADYGYQLGRHWGIGEKGKNNGALIIVAPNEHAVRIEVGYGLEGDLTDAKSRVIIERVMKPAFKKGDFDAGVLDGTKAVLGTLGNTSFAAPDYQRYERDQDEPSGWMTGLIIFALIFFFAGRSWFWPLLFLGGGGWGGGRGGWGGGGGFGGGGFGGGGFSGGGGSFGGGGASGRW